jgi:hypothetical protein
MTDTEKRAADEISDHELEGVSGGLGVAVISTSSGRTSGEKGGTEDINIGVGELQECTISKSMD